MKDRFQGDGRNMLEALPQYVRLNTMPLSVRRATARMIIDMFERTGFSNHSAMGGTLWIIVEHCETRKISYDINGSSTMGYMVRKLRK